ncbi:MAG TPA: RibD family protein [Devosiaceae bacterium]|jgi:riboflavin biosynthesis pyrimidine reductase
MKPRVIVHMVSSLDGKIELSRWSEVPGLAREALVEAYEEIHRKLEGDAWIVGRTTMAEFADGKPSLATTAEPVPRVTHRAGSGPRYAVALDRSGKLNWATNTANGDHVIEVLTEQVSDAYLSGLRATSVSYLFAGAEEIDLDLMLEKLHDEFGIKRLLLEGGGHINGSFATAGLVDELSLVLAPVIDGFSGATTVFEHEDASARSNGLALVAIERLPSDLVWLRYERRR